MSHLPALIVNFTPIGMVPTKEMTPHVPISVAEIVEQVHEAEVQSLHPDMGSLTLVRSISPARPASMLRR